MEIVEGQDFCPAGMESAQDIIKGSDKQSEVLDEKSIGIGLCWL